MDVRTYHVIIEAPAEAVFDLVSDVKNMPKWSIHFCRGIRVEADHAIIDSPAGQVYFAIDGDRRTGVLDWWSGPSRDLARRWPTRVTALPGGRSLYQVTGILSREEAQIPNLEQLFTEELAALKRLVENAQQ